MKVPKYIKLLLKSTAKYYHKATINELIILQWLERQGFNIENFDSYIDLIEMNNNSELFIKNLEDDRYEIYKRKED